MLRVLGCITEQHDGRLILLAGLLCLFASATGIGMLSRARISEPRLRAFWLGAAATVAGCGIWGTHFVAMLAFRPGLPVGYEPGLTTVSVIIAVGISAAGFSLALRNHALAGGFTVGLAISAMHYVGMAALLVPADAVWDATYVTASVLIGVGLAGLSIFCTFRGQTWTGYAQGAGLLALAIWGMHFTAMAAVTYSPNPLVAVPQGAILDPIGLAMTVAAGAILIVALGLTGVLVDNHLAHRTANEAERLRAHVQELEATKAQLEETSASLSAALSAADTANKAKTEFLAAMSHELRTPLNAVIGFAEIMLNEVYGPLGSSRYITYIRDIRSSGTHLLNLINDVLDLSRLEAGDLHLYEEQVNVGELVAEVMRQLGPQIEASEVAFITEIEPNLPEVRGDRRRLRQVVANLLANAVKFTPADGSIRIIAHLKDDELGISIVDTGIGIAPEDIPKALDRFGQVDSRIARKYDGVGLGLPLAKELIELHGGRLEIESQVQMGTTVTVFLPANRLTPARIAA